VPEPDAQGQILLRHARATLRVSIIGRPVDTLKAITWKMDDGAEQNLDLSKVAGQEITVPLELRRGVHKLRVTVKTPEAAAEYSEGVTLRYQPPSPIVKYTGDKTILVKEPEFNLRTLIQSGSKDEP